jgi:hypothetical protein
MQKELDVRMVLHYLVYWLGEELKKHFRGIHP